MTVENMEKRMEKLEKDNERSKAYIEIANLMGRYRYWHTGRRNEDIGKMWAKHTPGVRAELANSGVYEGERVGILWNNWKNGMQVERSWAEILPIASPVIEVAKDGKTGRGLWTALGTNTTAETKTARWSIEEYACDFVKEDGIWKFWRMHLYFVMRCEFYKSWLDEDNTKFIFDNSKLPPEQKADSPSTISIKEQMFLPGRIPLCSMSAYVPPAPEPYETYEEWMAVVPKK
jgi:hypothetical protein